MPRARALTALAALLLAAAAAADDSDILYDITEEEYYEMPQLFYLDEYEGCLATRGVYCLGSFDLLPAQRSRHELYIRMKRYTANWVDNFNHTQLHRGLCLSRHCPRLEPAQAGLPAPPAALADWFTSCVNESTMLAYNLSAHLRRLEYCARGPRSEVPALTTNQRAFAGLITTLFALAAVSTVLDWTLPDHSKKGLSWALTWSLSGSWRALQAPPPRSAETDLSAFDGLRVLCLTCVIIEHVCWLASQAFLADTWQFERMRRMTEVMLMINSTLVVQIFFLMSSFLLAHKLLQQRRRSEEVNRLATFKDTLLNRIIRVSPSYFVVMWFAASWWERLGRGPLWEPLVGAEAAICRRKWWTHLLYLNNVLYADDKCLIQTWYLAADMQLYALSLALTLALWRFRKGALYILTALLITSIGVPFTMAYLWRLVPTFVMHTPELVRQIYSGESSFNVLYQSPLSNTPGALAGLLLAHLHHALLDANVRLADYKVFRWVSIAGPALSVAWAATSPALLGAGPPPRAAAAALAALERPVFSFFVALGVLGAMHDIKSPLRTLLSWRGWATPARLSFGVLLLHMPINKSLVASRLVPSEINRKTALTETFGIALTSYLLALPLALLVEYPAQRLQRALARPAPRAPPAAPPRPDKAGLQG